MLLLNHPELWQFIFFQEIFHLNSKTIITFLSKYPYCVHFNQTMQFLFALDSSDCHYYDKNDTYIVLEIQLMQQKTHQKILLKFGFGSCRHLNVIWRLFKPSLVGKDFKFPSVHYFRQLCWFRSVSNVQRYNDC